MARSILHCAACARRAVLLPIPRRAALSVTPAAIPPSRRYATTTSEAEPAPETVTNVDAPRKFEAKELTPEEAEKRRKNRLETVVNKELRYLSEDPWQVQALVEKALKRDAFDEAYAIVQKRSSKDKQLVVAWNHLIDYLMQKQQMRKALKIFNDMKKRAQLPNVRTYSVIFRGLAIHEHPQTAVAEALKQYNYLLKDTRLEPNSIHLNAALTVCAKAGDLDALFVVADSINEGLRAPTASTYTVILNALRHKALEELKAPVMGESGAETTAWTDEQKEQHIGTLLDKAKSLWGEVLNKWRLGKLVIDEPLVCAMGRLLLMSAKKEDKREIFDLVETTMKIPNLVKNPELGAERDESTKGISSQTIIPRESQKSSRGLDKSGIYTIPSNNTLALILTALAYTREVTAGIKYWNLLVGHYGIVPDKDIWWRMLKMLRAVKASAHTVNMVAIMPEEFVDEKPFRIAMETCIRDNLNPNVVKHSTKIFDAMLERLMMPDPYVMRQYLRVALVTHKNFRDIAKQEGEGKSEEGKRLYGEQILKALGALWEPYKQSYYHFWRATEIRNPKALAKNENNKAEVIALARAMVSAFDKLTNEKMLTEAQEAEIKPVAVKIHREIRAHFANTVVTDPLLKKKIDKRSRTNMEVISQQEEKRFENDDPYDAFGQGLKVGPEWTWDTYKTPKTRSEIYKEEHIARLAKQKAKMETKLFFAAKGKKEKKAAREADRKKYFKEVTDPSREREEASPYPWEPDFEDEKPYNVMEERKKKPLWSPDSPWAKSGHRDKRYKANTFDPSKLRDDRYHKRPESLGGKQTLQLPRTMFYGDARDRNPDKSVYSKNTQKPKKAPKRAPQNPQTTNAFAAAFQERKK